MVVTYEMVYYQNTLIGGLKMTHNNKVLLKGFPPHIHLAYGIERHKPTFFGVHMRPFCNFRCRKCFIGEQKQLYGPNPILSTSEIESIMNSAANVGVKVMGISGAGEPFLDTRITEIIRVANNLGFITIIPTNGSVLTKDLVQFLRDNNVTLALSFDTTDADVFASITGTNPDMFRKVLDNILMAQDVYSGTLEEVTINGEHALLHRIAIHMTMQNDNQAEIDKVRRLVGKDTLFSISPLAKAGFAQHTNKSDDLQTDKNITERHIVVCFDERHECDICGFFRYGIDINFDGQLLLDAHAIETRDLFGNIRDFGYDIASAYSDMDNQKDEFVRNWLEGFCPVRSPRLNEWIGKKRGLPCES